MAKRNFGGGRPRRSGWKQLALTVLVFAAVAGLFLWGMAGVDATTQEEQLRVVERAVTKAVVQCYALEGQYPASAGYLRDNYGLWVDEEKYVVHIDFFGGNIMPHITVMERYF